MQLNLTTDYAIRSILFISTQPGSVPSTEIAAAMKIPQQYLIAVLTKLKHAGLVSVTRGNGGGYRLGRLPGEITLLNILEAVEGKTCINRCLEGEAHCSCFTTEHCPVRQVYSDIQDMLDENLRSVTLQTLREKL